MADKNFIKSIMSVAAEYKGSPITDDEKSKILESFSRKSGTEYEKAKAVIEEVFDKSTPKTRTIIEKSASINNLENLLQQMKEAAKKLKEEQNK